MRIYILLTILFFGFVTGYSQKHEDNLLMKNIALVQDFENIPEDRKTLLHELGDEIHLTLKEKKTVNITFICTHNSRRSQLSELWMRMAARHYNITGIESFSGGTESTAFNHRMVQAIERFGFEVQQMDTNDNPKYRVSQGDGIPCPKAMFSKKYSDSYNPSKDFIAVMVCGHADRNCPFVAGASVRVALPYLDPKAYDDTPEEAKAYDDKVIEIGRELMFLGKYIKELN